MIMSCALSFFFDFCYKNFKDSSKVCHWCNRRALYENKISTITLSLWKLEYHRNWKCTRRKKSGLEIWYLWTVSSKFRLNWAGVSQRTDETPYLWARHVLSEHIPPHGAPVVLLCDEAHHGHVFFVCIGLLSILVENTKKKNLCL